MEKIKAAADRYQTALNNVNNKRIMWNDHTEQFIFDTLQSLRNEIKLDWSVRKVERMRNLESVELSFNDGVSGIMEGGVALLKTYKKVGGKLIFTQAYSGQILVLYIPPFIQELMPPAQPQLLGEVEPDKITTDLIHNHVITFLENLSKWEGSDVQKVIVQ